MLQNKHLKKAISHKKCGTVTKSGLACAFATAWDCADNAGHKEIIWPCHKKGGRQWVPSFLKISNSMADALASLF